MAVKDGNEDGTDLWLYQLIGNSIKEELLASSDRVVETVRFISTW